MSRPRRFEIPDAYYHITARGDGRRAVFRSAAEMEIYLDLLGEVGEKVGWTLLAYCLMTNHVHLLVRRGDVPLARAMLLLQATFVMRANRRARRSGRRFGDRYRAWLVRDERHALIASCYIHRNPVAAGMADKAEAYGWSSMRAYMGGPRLAGVRPDDVLGWAGGAATYAEMVAAPPPPAPAVRWKGIPVFGEPGPALLQAADGERRIERPRRVVSWTDVVRAVVRVSGCDPTGTGHEAARCRAAVLATGGAFGLPLRGAAALLGYAAETPSTIIARIRARAGRDPAWAFLLRSAFEETARGSAHPIGLSEAA